MKFQRRRLLHATLAGAALYGSGLGLARGKVPGREETAPVRLGFELNVDRLPVNFSGKNRYAVAINGSVPAPTLRWREGDEVTIRVNNRLDVPTSIHWHGILLPANMDGVPGLSFDGIAPRSSFTYRFPLRQSGTYWYHSHSLFQEQLGHYGAIIVEPRQLQGPRWDREHVLVLSDWTDLDPEALFRRLKKMPSYDNRYKRTVGDFFHDIQSRGFAATIEDRRMWNSMRMTPTDLSDVNGHTYTWLINGRPNSQPWTGLFQPGERVLLRFINASGMTYFDVRIPGLKLTVVAADGQPVHPVSVDEFRIGVAETFDCIAAPEGADAFAVFAQDMGRTGYVAGILQSRTGAVATIPSVDERPLLGMQEMGHGADHGGMQHGGMDHSNTQHARMDHSGHSLKKGSLKQGSLKQGSQKHPRGESGNPLVDMQVMQVAARLDDPGIGLRDNGRRVLTYADLRSTFENPDGRDPSREIELHLTGHMEKFAWSFNGEPFAQAEPLRLKYGERVRVVLVNDTMMHHPIHLHGMWSDLEDESSDFLVRKHTIDMPPATRRAFRVRADALGRWAFHCHLLYHMEAGMMREVWVDT
jgi:CopA family copper-resistance protein